MKNKLVLLEIGIALGISIWEAYKYYKQKTKDESKKSKKRDRDDPSTDGESVIYKL